MQSRDFSTILRDCVRKVIASVPGVPSIRSCPHCREAIEHTDACNNMQYFSCKKHFCFVCLTKASANGSLACPQRHAVAPVQTLYSEEMTP